MYKTIAKPTMSRMRLKQYLNSSRDDYVKTEKCEKCKTIYVVNPTSTKYHQDGKCFHLHSGYYHNQAEKRKTQERKKKKRK
jgi:hypothetical protein